MGIALEHQARHREYHIKLALIADHRMWDQLNKQNSVQVHGSHMTTGKKKKKLWHVNSVFFALGGNSRCIDLISQTTHNYRKQFLTAVLLADAMILPSRLSSWRSFLLNIYELTDAACFTNCTSEL